MNTFPRILPLAAIFICTQTWAIPVTPTWTDSFDPLVGDSSANHVAASGDIAYVAGAGPFKGTPSSDADIRVRAYGVGDGALLWEDVWDASGIHQDDEVTDVVTAGARVYIAGSAGTNTSTSNALVVRAYDRHNGQVLWEDHCGQSGSGAKALAADTRRVVVVGVCSPAQDGIGLIRVYSSTGAQIWQANDVALPLDVTLAGDVVLVAGTDAGGSLILHAYNAKQGKLLWEARPAAAQTLSLRSALITADPGKVYLAWDAVDDGGQATDQIAVYNTRNGAQRWLADPGDRINDLVLAAGVLFAAQQGDQTLVSAYDAGRGKLLWQDQPGTSANPHTGLALTFGGNQVLVAGQAYDPTVDNAPHFMMRAYNRSGRLLWEDETPTTTLQGAEAMDVAWTRGMAIASGMDSRSDPPFGTTHWLVRAYPTPRHMRGP